MMWELIRQNRRKSFWLFAGMAVLLVLLGFFVGNVFDPEYGGYIGLAFAIAMWVFLTLLAVNSGGEILLKASGARRVTKDVHPRLFNVVEEMKIAAGLPAMPDVYIIDEPAPNAFAIGIKPMLGSIVLISQFFLRSWWFMPSSSRRYRSSGPGGGNAQMQIIMVAVAILLAILAPVFARLLYLAISRKREYLADATAVRLTRYPDGLANALEKISSVSIPLEGANAVTAPMYIAAPVLHKKMKLSGLGSTHPPMEERIKILRFMTKGADYRSYQRAYSRLHGKPTPLIPPSQLKKKQHVEIREPSAEPEDTRGKKKSARDVMDIMRAVNNYAFLACACGLKMKLPPDFPADKLSCPKCGKENAVPVAQLAAIAAMVGATVGPEEAALADESESSAGLLEYERKGTGWETFACACGRLLQLSPAFRVHHLTCAKCGRVTRIKIKR
jgi:heat shock protein HtpX